MSIPLSRMIKEHTCRKVDPADMTTYREIVIRDLLPSNGTDERIELQRGFAVTGCEIAPESRLHICPFCGGVVHRDDTFVCIKCQLIGCKTHAAQIELLAEPTPAKPEGPAPSGQSPLVIGICKPCAKKAFWQAVVWFPVTLLLRPILAIFAPPPPPQVGPPPAARLLPIALIVFGLASAVPHRCESRFCLPKMNGSMFQEVAPMSQPNNRIPLAQATLVIEEALRRGYERRLGKAESIHVRDLQLSLVSGVVDERSVLGLQEIMAVEDVLAPTPDYFKVFLPEPGPADLATGELLAFWTPSGAPVKHAAVEQCAQVRVFGRFGSGKTSCDYGIARENIAHGHSCLVVDSKGNQFDSLLTLFPGTILKLKVGRERILNPWKYPDQATEDFCKLHERFDSQAVLDMGAFALRHPPAGTPAETVTFSKLITLIPKVHAPAGFPDVKRELRQSLLAVGLEVFNSPVLRSIDCETGLDIAALIKAGVSVIVDTSEIAGTTHEDWFVTALLLNAREDIRNDPVLASRPGQLLLFTVDEASSIGASVRSYTRGLHPFAQLVTLCRGSGISVLLSYHSPSTAAEILHSAHIMVCASLVNGPDIWAVKKALFLSDEQAQALSQLPVGHGVMLIAGRCPQPFAVRWNDFPPVPAPNATDIARSNAAILARLPAITQDPCRLELLFLPPAPARTPPPVPAPAPITPIDRDILYLLEHLDRDPLLNVTERAKALTFPSGTRVTYKNLRGLLGDLMKSKDVGFIQVQMSARGGVSEYWYLTPDTRIRLFGSSGARRGGTGPAHTLLQMLVHQILANRGIPSQVEAML